MYFEILSRTNEKDYKNFEKPELSKQSYFKIRNLAWQTLLDNNIKELPVNLKLIIQNNKWRCNSFSKIKNEELKKEISNCWGITINLDGAYFIFYDNNLNKEIINFTIAHEIGHILLNHFKELNISKDLTKINELEASMFAARLLMPISVLNRLNVQSVSEIARICNVSIKAAMHRFIRLQKLKDRNRFETSNIEKKLVKQFNKYINNKR